jgi:hypothetical protein
LRTAQALIAAAAGWSVWLLAEWRHLFEQVRFIRIEYRPRPGGMKWMEPHFVTEVPFQGEVSIAWWVWLLIVALLLVIVRVLVRALSQARFFWAAMAALGYAVASATGGAALLYAIVYRLLFGDPVDPPTPGFGVPAVFGAVACFLFWIDHKRRPATTSSERPTSVAP